MIWLILGVLFLVVGSLFIWGLCRAASKEMPPPPRKPE